MIQYRMEVSIKSLDGQNKKFEAVPLDYTVRQFKDLIFSQMVYDIFMFTKRFILVLIKISAFLSFSFLEYPSRISTPYFSGTRPSG